MPGAASSESTYAVVVQEAEAEAAKLRLSRSQSRLVVLWAEETKAAEGNNVWQPVPFVGRDAATRLELWTCAEHEPETSSPRTWSYLYCDFRVYFLVMCASTRRAHVIMSWPAPLAATRRVERITLPHDDKTNGVHRLLNIAAAANTLALQRAFRGRDTWHDPVFPMLTNPFLPGNSSDFQAKADAAQTVLLFTKLADREVFGARALTNAAAALLDSAADAVGVVTTKEVLRGADAALRGNDAADLTKAVGRFVSVHGFPDTVKCGVASPLATGGNCNLYRLLVESKQTPHAHSVAASLLGTAAHVCFDADLVRRPGYTSVIGALPVASIVAGMAAASAVRRAFGPALAVGPARIALAPGTAVEENAADATAPPRLVGFRPDAVFTATHGGRPRQTHCAELKTVWRRSGGITPRMHYLFRAQALLQAWAARADRAVLVTVVVPYNDSFAEVRVDVQACKVPTAADGHNMLGELGITTTTKPKPKKHGSSVQEGPKYSIASFVQRLMPAGTNQLHETHYRVRWEGFKPHKDTIQSESMLREDLGATTFKKHVRNLDESVAVVEPGGFEAGHTMAWWTTDAIAPVAKGAESYRDAATFLLLLKATANEATFQRKAAEHATEQKARRVRWWEEAQKTLESQAKCRKMPTVYCLDSTTRRIRESTGTRALRSLTVDTFREKWRVHCANLMEDAGAAPSAKPPR